MSIQYPCNLVYGDSISLDLNGTTIQLHAPGALQLADDFELLAAIMNGSSKLTVQESWPSKWHRRFGIGRKLIGHRRYMLGDPKKPLRVSDVLPGVQAPDWQLELLRRFSQA